MLNTGPVLPIAIAIHRGEQRVIIYEMNHHMMISSYDDSNKVSNLSCQYWSDNNTSFGMKLSIFVWIFPWIPDWKINHVILSGEEAIWVQGPDSSAEVIWAVKHSQIVCCCYKTGLTGRTLVHWTHPSLWSKERIYMGGGRSAYLLLLGLSWVGNAVEWSAEEKKGRRRTNVLNVSPPCSRLCEPALKKLHPPALTSTLHTLLPRIQWISMTR